MTRSRRPPSALTLIELLVVVTIVAVLLSLALSTVSIVREAAYAARCASNFQQIGISMTVFAEDNGRRFPGGGTEQIGTVVRSVNWQDILNREVLEDEIKTERMGKKKNPDSLSCPSYRSPPGGTPYRSYGMNRDALGGPVASGGVPPYGRLVTPPTTKGARFIWYSLGALPARFPRPAGKVLIQEDEQPRDTAWCSGGTYAGVFVFTPGPSLSRFAVNNGGYAFRHNGSGNVMFVDLHVEAIGMGRTDINQPSAYALTLP